MALGCSIGLLSPVPEQHLTDSIDRRANLENRLGSARQITEGEFGAALQVDAESHLNHLRPSKLFPFRFGRAELSVAILSLLFVSIFLLGNSPIFLGKQDKKDREAEKAAAKDVERVTRENFDPPEAKHGLNADQQAVANELSRLARDMEKARLSRDQLETREADLAKKADELVHQSSELAQQNLATAQSALQSMEKAELEKQGANNISQNQAQMSDSQRKAEQDKNRQKQADIHKQLSAIDKRLAELRKKLAEKGLSPQERKALEAEMKELEAQRSALAEQLKHAEEDAKALQLSEEARESFQKLAEDPLFKKLQELQQKLSKNLRAMQQGKRPALSKAEREQLRQELEALAKQLNSDKARKEYLEAMMEALKQANEMGQMMGVLDGLPGIPMWGNGTPGNDQDRMPYDLGMINKTDKPVAGRGSTTLTSVSGDVRPDAGPQQYVEIKAPSMIGNRSSVPYVNVLPSYRRKAEQAIDHQQIPKEQEKRVREYFESLNGK
jgi:chemotaxis protein histidine kinase CheA